MKERTDETRQMEYDSRNELATGGQPGKDSRERTAETGKPELESQDRKTETGQPRQEYSLDRQDSRLGTFGIGQSGQDSLDTADSYSWDRPVRVG